MLNHKFWEKYFKDYDILNIVIPYRELLKTICDELDIKKGEKILEAGSGTGNLALEIKKRGAEVIGFDISEEGLNRHKLKDPEANIILGDLTKKLPFPDNYFNKICSNNTLYAIPIEKRKDVMREFYRISKPGGKILISNLAVGFKPFKIYLDHIEKRIKNNGLIYAVKEIITLSIPTIKMFYYNYLIKKENKEGDFNFFGINEQKELLGKAGFKNISETKKVFTNQAILNSAFK